MQTKPIAAALLAAAALAGCGTAQTSSPPAPAPAAAPPSLGSAIQNAATEGTAGMPPCPPGFVSTAWSHSDLPEGHCKDVRHLPCPAGYTGWQNTQYDNCLEKPS